jgi:C-terminal processing protease CtpA/Prc
MIIGLVMLIITMILMVVKKAAYNRWVLLALFRSFGLLSLSTWLHSAETTSRHWNAGGDIEDKVRAAIYLSWLGVLCAFIVFNLLLIIGAASSSVAPNHAKCKKAVTNANQAAAAAAAAATAQQDKLQGQVASLEERLKASMANDDSDAAQINHFKKLAAQRHEAGRALLAHKESQWNTERKELLGDIKEYEEALGELKDDAVEKKELVRSAREEFADMQKIIGISIKDGPAHGTLVSGVKAGSPAAMAGLQVNDVVEEVDGNDTGDREDLKNMLASSKPGDEVAFQINRNDAISSVMVVVGGQSKDKTKQYTLSEIRRVRRLANGIVKPSDLK